MEVVRRQTHAFSVIQKSEEMGEALDERQGAVHKNLQVFCPPVITLDLVVVSSSIGLEQSL